MKVRKEEKRGTGKIERGWGKKHILYTCSFYHRLGNAGGSLWPVMHWLRESPTAAVRSRGVARQQRYSRGIETILI